MYILALKRLFTAAITHFGPAAAPYLAHCEMPNRRPSVDLPAIAAGRSLRLAAVSICVSAQANENVLVVRCLSGCKLNVRTSTAQNPALQRRDTLGKVILHGVSRVFRDRRPAEPVQRRASHVITDRRATIAG